MLKDNTNKVEDNKTFESVVRDRNQVLFEIVPAEYPNLKQVCL